MTAAKQPLKTAKTATGTAYRGTTKRIREAGVDLGKPVLYRGEHFTTPAAQGVRYERIECGRSFVGITAAGERVYVGSAATRYWLEQIVEVPAAVEAPAVEVGDEADPTVNGKKLSTMTFAEVMRIAKVYRTPGRGTARIEALRAGVAEAIKQDGGAMASIICW